MCILDAIILNPDRHYGNFGVLFDTATMEVLQMAPVFDNNKSLLPELDNDQLAAPDWYIARCRPADRQGLHPDRPGTADGRDPGRPGADAGFYLPAAPEDPGGADAAGRPERYRAGADQADPGVDWKQFTMVLGTTGHMPVVPIFAL